MSGVTLRVEGGEIVVILGHNGSGKTTLLRALAGLHPAAGTVRLGGADATGWPPERRARAGLGHLDQQPSAFRGLSVRDNLRAVLEVAGAGDADERADAELERLGLTELAARRADRLSVGERRRLELARALCRRPRWLLADEPLAGLDAPEAARAARRLREEARAGGAAVLFAAPEAPDGLCDRTLRLRDGRLVEA